MSDKLNELRKRIAEKQKGLLSEPSLSNEFLFIRNTGVYLTLDMVLRMIDELEAKRSYDSSWMRKENKKSDFYEKEPDK